MKKKWLAVVLVASLGLAAVLAGLNRQSLSTAFYLIKERLLDDSGTITVENSLNRKLQTIGWKNGGEVFIRIFKDEHALELFGKHQGKWELLKAYKICRYSGRLGPKFAEGDRQAPEGFYVVGKKQLNPFSNHHLSFNLGFPNAVERAQGKTGSFLMIHGGCSSIGCYAITDPGIDEVYRIVESALNHGQQQVAVHAFPFRMTEEKLAEYKGHAAYGFWQKLKPAYEAFEAQRDLPTVLACNDQYGFHFEKDATGKKLPKGCSPLKAW